MRTEVIKLLDCSSKENKSKIVKPTHDIIFLNELVREYLDWMGYKYSSTVFIAGTHCYFTEYNIAICVIILRIAIEIALDVE